MCYYITATLPKEADLAVIESIIRRYEMGFEPLNNKKIKSQLRPGELYFRATKDYCDCDTVLGSLNTSQEVESLRHSKKLKNLQRKGWTEEQINEWVTKHLKKIEEKKEADRYKTKHYPELDRQKATRWINFQTELLRSGSVSRVGLLKHWYTGNLETEPIIIKQTQRINTENITTDLLMHLENDILYEFFQKNMICKSNLFRQK